MATRLISKPRRVLFTADPGAGLVSRGAAEDTDGARNSSRMIGFVCALRACLQPTGPWPAGPGTLRSADPTVRHTSPWFGVQIGNARPSRPTTGVALRSAEYTASSLASAAAR